MAHVISSGLEGVLTKVTTVTENMLKLGKWNGWATPEREDQLNHVMSFQPLEIRGNDAHTR